MSGFFLSKGSSRWGTEPLFESKYNTRPPSIIPVAEIYFSLSNLGLNGRWKLKDLGQNCKMYPQTTSFLVICVARWGFMASQAMGP